MGAIARRTTDLSLRPAYKRFAAAFLKEAGSAPQPGMYQANTYDAQILLSLAIAAAGTTEGEKVAKQLPLIANAPGDLCSSFVDCLNLIKAGKEINYQGASGPIELDQFGNIESAPFAEMVVKDGTWQEGRKVGQ